MVISILKHNFYLGSYGGAAKYNIDAEPLFDFGTFSADLEVDRSDDNLYTIRKYGAESADTSHSMTRMEIISVQVNYRVSSRSFAFNLRIAINGSTDRLYYRVGWQLKISTPGPTKVIPDVSTDSASDFQATSVKVHGSVNPDGVTTTTCNFEYGRTEFSSKKSVPCEQGEALNGSDQQEVTATLTGLTPGTVLLRLKVDNGDDQVVGRY